MHLSEGYINGNHLLKKSDWSEQYLYLWIIWKLILRRKCEGYINGNHLMKKSGWSDEYVHFIKVMKKSLSFENAFVRRKHKWHPFVEKIRLFRSISYFYGLFRSWILVMYSCKKCFIKVKVKTFELCKSPCQKGS